MRGNIIAYIEMCKTEGTSLQKGMNFRLKGKHSVILMSVRKNSPYQDEITEDVTGLIYEGHDVPKTKGINDPKILINGVGVKLNLKKGSLLLSQ